MMIVAVPYLKGEQPKEKCIRITGTVSKITEGGVKDAVFTLQNHKSSYYINRGLENGLTLKELRSALSGEEITIYCSNPWTSFAPFGTCSKHICELKVNDYVVYSEFK